ncbi:hypothetical protein [Roseomonas sp. CECT 9278]|uniref:head-tail joining protein n=1 Tax=Roseomonas sp. CECT 9278 TaxID=2845823 RepID=UPI001E5120A3|nr:hypothetical protein [Roseomonas sp. CECT 9278]CAH0126972.1 hypothetical protein ROS9278_00115 [Roseomonas sp. CECT 9278]
MGVFDDALAVLAADPNLGVDATYRAAGAGAPVPLRILRSSPDRVVDAFDTPMLRATDVLTVSIALLAAIEPGDTFTVGPDLLTVDSAERDAAGVAWRVLCRR